MWTVRLHEDKIMDKALQTNSQCSVTQTQTDNWVGGLLNIGERLNRKSNEKEIWKKTGAIIEVS